MGRIWFTSDTHYGHTGIIGYVNRPFRNVDEMDQTMVARYRELVAEGDDVYILGDLSFYKDRRRTYDLFSRLPGKKRWVFGNHDKKLRDDSRIRSIFLDCGDMMEVKVPDPDGDGGNRKVVLCHYPMRVWNKSHFGSYHLYGHSHGSLPDDPHSLSLDVGVDCWDFYPVSYKRVKERMSRKVFKPVDRHERKR